MNVTVDRAAFLAELQLCAAITPRRAIPILAAVRIGAEKDRVTLGATDLDLTILTSCAAEIVETGELCVEAQVLLEMVRSLDGETVTLTGGEGGKPVTVTSGAARFDTPTWPVDDFPVLPQMDGEAARTIDLVTLQTLLALTRDALGDDTARFTANRTCLRFGDGEVRVFAVQGNWLAAARTATARQPGETIYGLTAAAGRLLGKFEAIGNAEAWFTANDSHLAITVDHRTIMDRQSELNFPDYEKHLPKVTERAIVNRETLLAVTKRANIVARGSRSMCLRLTFSSAPGRLEITHTDPVRGKFSESIPIEYSGTGFTVGYGGGYLASAVGLMDCPAVEFGVGTNDGGVKHAIIVPTKESEIHKLAVIAEMQLGGRS